MQALEHQLPRVFQANILRLYDRVVRPGVELLPVHSELAFGMAPTLDAFLDRAAAQVDNYTANEAAKAFALTIAAVFERQLSAWARMIAAGGGASRVGRTPRYEELLTLCASYAGLDLDRLGVQADLTELLLVGNVVRHGEGPSCDRLRGLAPSLWAYAPSAYIDIVSKAPPVSERMQVSADDLARYVRAAARFWGHADPQPMAAREIPV
ncbi:MAG TPA: hypothetical protein VIP08_09375 [Phenylobacterium sp.]|uniref:hypothetical protein n=1 Tax=Phenylobacterium sp. TaxID=1871053 RepID=UPI002F95EC73